MRNLLVMGIILILLASGCTTEQPAAPEGKARPSAGNYQYIPQEKNSDLEEMSFRPIESSSYLEISVPADWDDDMDDSCLVSLTRPDGVCSFRLVESDNDKASYEEELKDEIVGSDGQILQESPLNYVTTDEGTIFTETMGVECGSKLYFAFYSCVQDRYDINKGEEIFDTMICRDG